MTKKPKSWSFTFLNEEHDKILQKRILESQKGTSEYLRDVQLNALGLNNHLASSDSSPTSPSPKRSEEEGLPQETQSILDSEIPCFCRFEHNGLLWCANRPPPNSGKITTLKRCGACLKRITKDKISSGLKVKTRYYTTCGAKEHYDKKKGLMLYCSKHFQGQYVTPKDCLTAKCLDIKEVKTEDG